VWEFLAIVLEYRTSGGNAAAAVVVVVVVVVETGRRTH
jgi:hypothetical protein